MRLLVVEDNIDITTMLRYQLADTADCEFVDNAEAVLNGSVDPSRFDCVLTDLMLPDTDGVTLLRYLAVNHPNVRRVAMTAGLDLASEAHGYADVLLIKPFHHDDLLRALRD